MSVFDTDNESLNSSPELSNCFENSLHRDSGVYFFFQLLLFLCFLFIHSSLDGLLGCFHLLAIGHNASVNTSTQICLGLSAFNSFGYNPEGELPDHFVILFLIF